MPAHHHIVNRALTGLNARAVLLGGAAALLLVLAFLTGDARDSSAQSVTPIDYDLDDDGLIEVTNANQWRAIHYDLDGDGTPNTIGAPVWCGTSTPWGRLIRMR